MKTPETLSHNSGTSNADQVVPRFNDPLLVDEKITTCDYAALKRLLNEVAYDKPDKAERVPWLERLDFVTSDTLPDNLAANADIEREDLIFAHSIKALKQILLKLKYLGVSFARPKDFLAQMMKSDEHMQRIRERLDAQQVRIRNFENRKNKIKCVKKKLKSKGGVKKSNIK